ncbi:MAG TPA: hypothetical protein ENH37_02535 [Deltaproteobacteria bacterium]|nr:hypothetical protein [Deltaproteobacteria bacterium]
MAVRKIYLFSDSDATQEQVGGKAYSLIRMTAGGFPVPPGMVLAVRFFEEWLEELLSMEDLRLLPTDSDEALKEKTKTLQQLAGVLPFTSDQRKLLHEHIDMLQVPGDRIFSVRSSSPEEDMRGASFAGMYETCLGVRPRDLEDRIRRVFVSCLDYRVVTYKRQKGFDFTTYSIAVVVMAMIRSETAGVAFSINPLNNCYDEVVINANFGLGESIVSGDTVPDQFVVDKYRDKILSEKIGAKNISIQLDQEGGTKTVSSERKDQRTLTREQILELARMVRRVEEYYHMPMDTEWGYADGKFYMLQARPITTYIPLHPDFLTKPGEQKRLYLDMTLIEQGIQKPLSVMGADCFRLLSNGMGLSAAGTPIAEKPGDFMWAAGGRAYVNLSAEFLLEGQKGTAREYEGLDSYAAQIIRDADISEYRLKYSTKGVLKALKSVFVGMFKSSDLVGGIIKGIRSPEKLREKIDKAGGQFIEEIDRLYQAPISFGEFAEQAMQKSADLMVHTTIPSLIDAQSAKKKLQKLFKDEFGDDLTAEVDKIDRGLPYNVTIDMSCRIYELMSLLDEKEFESLEKLQEKIAKRALPEEFMKKWDEFMELYGFRGPREVDIKTPRYHDDPGIVLLQMQGYCGLDRENSPKALLQRQAADREKAYKSLTAKVKNKKELEKQYNILLNLGGYREIHKYYMVYAGEKIRRKALQVADELVRKNRIDDLNDVFYLTVEELQRAIDDPGLDVRAMIEHNREFMTRVENIDNFPPVIDSRGKILRPDRKKPAEGEIIGDPVSAGTVRGRAVVINFVGEKEVREGDILVARAADPGWTPLFINAAGILLEVGGMLQHGSLIAREYGKPCIAGIEGLTAFLKDGDMVEMDGSTGLVRKTTRGTSLNNKIT